MTAEAASIPCLRAFKRELAFPSSERGPVDFCEFRLIRVDLCSGCHNDHAAAGERGGSGRVEGISAMESGEKNFHGLDDRRFLAEDLVDEIVQGHTFDRSPPRDACGLP